MMDFRSILNVINEERIKRLHGWLNGKPQPPIKFTGFITQKCNLKCLFCGVPKCIELGKFDFSNEITTKKWLEIVNEGIKMGIMEWEVLGIGEALMRPDVAVGIIEKVKKKVRNSYFLLTTNGSLFNSEIIERIVKAELDRIQLSIDAPDAKTHNYLRVIEGTFEKSISSIKEINSFKKELNKMKPILSINMVLNAKNCDKIISMINICSKIGVEELIITPMRIDQDNAQRIEYGKLIMNDQQIERFHNHSDMYKKIAQEKKVDLQLLVTKGKEKIVGPTDDIVEEKCYDKFLSSPCYEPWYNVIVDPLGHVGPCITSASFANKNLNLTRMSLEEAWYSKEMNEIRNRRLNRIPLPQCSHCTVTEMRRQIRQELIDFLKENGEYEKNRR